MRATTKARTMAKRGQERGKRAEAGVIKLTTRCVSNLSVCVYTLAAYVCPQCECHLFISTTTTKSGMKNKSVINLAINLLGLTVQRLPVTINIT